MTVAPITKYHALRAIETFAHMALFQTREGYEEVWVGEEERRLEEGRLVGAVLAKANEEAAGEIERQIAEGYERPRADLVDAATTIFGTRTKAEIDLLAEILLSLAQILQSDDSDEGGAP